MRAVIGRRGDPEAADPASVAWAARWATLPGTDILAHRLRPAQITDRREAEMDTDTLLRIRRTGSLPIQSLGQAE